MTVSDVLSRIGDKWTVLVIVTLSRGSLRFSEIEREIGNISKKMLTSTLRALERDGMVERAVTPSRPPRVDYTLTELGCELREPLMALGEWARINAGRIEQARRRFDRTETGGAQPWQSLG
ncbi:MAG: helix-turn-helix transcriptional regulator [Proteobacteria bacterium]|nr:helix-turn-helix transcriptional regulator [Pseudomonadota bacterium]